MNYTVDSWRAEGLRLFGEDFTNWRFKCPHCGRITTGQEFKDLGLPPAKMYQECIGRYDNSRGCNWAAYGLFDICTTHVDGTPVFDFAPKEDTHNE